MPCPVCGLESKYTCCEYCFPPAQFSRPYKCPVCDGSGKVGRPPWVAGDQRVFSAGETGPWPCRACNGSGILWSATSG